MGLRARAAARPHEGRCRQPGARRRLGRGVASRTLCRRAWRRGSSGWLPGFTDRIIARHAASALDLQRANANLVGGSLDGGSSRLGQQLFLRPIPGLGRAETPVKGLFLASSSAHPGGGVHGACGNNTARAALLHHRIGRALRFGGLDQTPRTGPRGTRSTEHPVRAGRGRTTRLVGHVEEDAEEEDQRPAQEGEPRHQAQRGHTR